MLPAWRSRVQAVVFNWLWHQLRHEGTRQWLLDHSLRGLRCLLLLNTELGARIWLDVFEESDRLYRSRRCHQLFRSLEPLSCRRSVAPLLPYFRARLSYRRGHLKRAESCYLRLLMTRPKTTCDTRLQAHVFESLGKLNYDQGRLALAERMLKAAARVWKDLKDRTGLASTYALLALVHRRRSDWKRSVYYSGKALTVLRMPATPNQTHIAGTVLLGLSILHRILGRFRQSRYLLTKAEVLFYRANDPVGLALILNQRARTALWQGKPKEGLEEAGHALRTFVECGATFESGLALRALGDLYLASGRLRLAERYYRKSLGLFRHPKNPYLTGMLLTNLAEVERRYRNFRSARRYLNQAVQAEIESGDELALGWTLKQQGLLEAAQGHTAQAILSLERSLAILRRYRNRPQVRVVADHLSKFYALQGR